MTKRADIRAGVFCWEGDSALLPLYTAASYSIEEENYLKNGKGIARLISTERSMTRAEHIANRLNSECRPSIN